MEPSYSYQRPPKYSTEPSPPYRKIAPRPPYPNGPTPEDLNEMFRYVYLRKKRDGWRAALDDFIAKNRDYKVELLGNDGTLRIILPDACYMSMEFEDLRKIRLRLEAALLNGKLLSYWEIDVERNYKTDRGLVEAKLSIEYQERLVRDEGFRRMEATKTASIRLVEHNQRVNHSLFHG